jgi:hypothetical protein
VRIAVVCYAVVWSKPGGPVHAGRLEFDDASLRLSGASRSAGEAMSLEVPYEALGELEIERRPSLRLGGRPTLVLSLRDGTRICLASLEGAGSLHELAERLEAVRGHTLV